MPKLKKRYKKELRRIAEYLVSGGAQFWSGYAAFAVFDLAFQMPEWPNLVVSYTIGVIVNFYLQRYWVFGKKHISKKQLHDSAVKYYGLMFTNFLLNLAIVGGLFELAGITPYIGQFVSAGFFTVYNYILFKFWVFNKKKPFSRHSATAARAHQTRKTTSKRPSRKR